MRNSSVNRLKVSLSSLDIFSRSLSSEDGEEKICVVWKDKGEMALMALGIVVAPEAWLKNALQSFHMELASQNVHPIFEPREDVMVFKRERDRKKWIERENKHSIFVFC